jgi:hypothetical protein
MQTVSACGIAAAAGLCMACVGTLIPVRLQPEKRATIHVGEVAVVQVSGAEDVIGSAGSALLLDKRTHQRGTTIYSYRAVKIGNHILVVTPRDIPDGHCISCVTEHYFVTVVR